jgi:hypothetical protein
MTAKVISLLLKDVQEPDTWHGIGIALRSNVENNTYIIHSAYGLMNP